MATRGCDVSRTQEHSKRVSEGHHQDTSQARSRPHEVVDAPKRDLPQEGRNDQRHESSSNRVSAKGGMYD